MSKKKNNKLTDEQKKAKRSKSWFTLFMVLVILVCVGIGLYNGLTPLFHTISLLKSYQTALNDSDTTNLLTTNKMMDSDYTLFVQKAKASGLNIFNAYDNVDQTKWSSNKSLSSSLSLTDKEIGQFFNNTQADSIYNFLEVTITYTGSAYTLYSVAQFTTTQITNSSSTFAKYVPTKINLTTTSTITVSSNTLTMDAQTSFVRINNMTKENSKTFCDLLSGESNSMPNLQIIVNKTLLNMINQFNSDTLASLQVSSNLVAFNK